METSKSHIVFRKQARNKPQVVLFIEIKHFKSHQNKLSCDDTVKCFHEMWPKDVLYFCETTTLHKVSGKEKHRMYYEDVFNLSAFCLTRPQWELTLFHTTSISYNRELNEFKYLQRHNPPSACPNLCQKKRCLSHHKDMG